MEGKSLAGEAAPQHGLESDRAQGRTHADSAQDYESSLLSNTLPRGWTSVSHISGTTCYFHQESRVVTWTRPYICPSEHHVEIHSPPLRTFQPSFTLSNAFTSANPRVLFTEIYDLCMETLKKSSLGLKRKRGAGFHATEGNKGGELSSKEKKARSVETAQEYGPDVADTIAQKDEDSAASLFSASKGSSSNFVADSGLSSTDVCQGQNDKAAKLAKTQKKKEAKEARRQALRNGENDIPSPEGKTAISFLQEYTMTKLKCLPKYVIKEADDPLCPYSCSVYLDGIEYGKAEYGNKKMAKQLAAEATLDMLLPGFWQDLKAKGQVLSPLHGEQLPTSTNNSQNMTISQFIRLQVEDPRVVPACAELGIKTPAQVLQEYQNRNPGIIVNYKSEQTQRSNEELAATGTTHQFLFKFIASCGNRVGVGSGFAKKMAKQYSAQALLKELHPNVELYITLVEMYSRDNTRGPGSKQGRAGQPGSHKKRQLGHPRPLASTDRANSRSTQADNYGPRLSYSVTSASTQDAPLRNMDSLSHVDNTGNREHGFEWASPTHKQSSFHREPGLDVGSNFDVRGNHSRAGFSLLSQLKEEMRKRANTDATQTPGPDGVEPSPSPKASGSREEELDSIQF